MKLVDGRPNYVPRMKQERSHPSDSKNKACLKIKTPICGADAWGYIGIRASV
jgi:hypothetical protein